MKSIVSKPVIFIILIVLAGAFGLLGFRSNSAFFDDLWSQLFWMIIGVIVTVFALETILQQDQEARRRKEDAFAFRTFTANMMRLLLKMGDASSNLQDDIMKAALAGNKEFATAAEKANAAISSMTNIRADPYDLSGGEILNGLKDLSRNYIRLFSSSQKEMVQTYKDLQELASNWKYRGALTDGFLAYTKSLDPGSRERQEREAETAHQIGEVQQLSIDTARYLMELAQRVARHPGMPAAP